MLPLDKEPSLFKKRTECVPNTPLFLASDRTIRSFNFALEFEYLNRPLLVRVASLDMIRCVVLSGNGFKADSTESPFTSHRVDLIEERVVCCMLCPRV